MEISIVQVNTMVKESIWLDGARKQSMIGLPIKRNTFEMSVFLSSLLKLKWENFYSQGEIAEKSAVGICSLWNRPLLWSLTSFILSSIVFRSEGVF